MSSIVAGQAGGLPLKSVPGTATRPTTQRTKEALFSWLSSRDWLAGNAVLDLYSGSGALGMEAASRGAQRVVGVEQARTAADIAQHNANVVNRALGQQIVTITRAPVEKFLHTTQPASWDVILADPPYDLDAKDLTELLDSIVEPLMHDGLFVLERPTKAPEPTWPHSLQRIDARRYGEATVYYVRPHTTQ